jgi:hypothetical protein
LHKAVGARKYSIPRQIAVPGPVGRACRRNPCRKKEGFCLYRVARLRPEEISGTLKSDLRQPIFGNAVPVNQEKQLFFNFFHRLFFYCFLNSFN